jgi:hypothetical protein
VPIGIEEYLPGGSCTSELGRRLGGPTFEVGC